MKSRLRALRYLRVGCADLKAATTFARDVIGLQAAGSGDHMALYRSDSRAYSLCLTSDDLGNL
jgi:hypothetical protein